MQRRSKNKRRKSKDFRPPRRQVVISAALMACAYEQGLRAAGTPANDVPRQLLGLAKRHAHREFNYPRPSRLGAQFDPQDPKKIVVWIR